MSLCFINQRLIVRVKLPGSVFEKRLQRFACFLDPLIFVRHYFVKILANLILLPCCPCYEPQKPLVLLMPLPLHVVQTRQHVILHTRRPWRFAVVSRLTRMLDVYFGGESELRPESFCLCRLLVLGGLLLSSYRIYEMVTSQEKSIYLASTHGLWPSSSAEFWGVSGKLWRVSWSHLKR